MIGNDGVSMGNANVSEVRKIALLRERQGNAERQTEYPKVMCSINFRQT